MGILLPIASFLVGIWLFRLALSERASQYPAPRVGRVAVIGIALTSLATAFTASAAVGFEGQLSSNWELRLAYGVSGLLAAFMCMTAGLYAFALAPGAYERQHPEHPSEFGTKMTAVIGAISGLILMMLGLAAGVIAVFLVATVPGS